MARKKLVKKKKKDLPLKTREDLIDFVEQVAGKEAIGSVMAGKPTESPKTALYSCELKVNDKIYKAAGNTLEEALNNIKIEPTHGVVKIYTKGVLKIRKGEKEVERLLFIHQMSRLFGQASKLGRECAMVQATRLIGALLNDSRTK